MAGKAQVKAQQKTKGKGGKNSDDEAYVATKAQKKKDNQANNDGPKIKRNQSAFFHFCNERRLQLKTEKPELKMTQQTQFMSEEWKKLDPKKKKKYEDMASKDKERYEREKKDECGNGHSQSGKKQKNKKEKEEGEPKKPMGSYFLYLEDRRETIKKDFPNLSHKEQLAQMGKEWNEMDPKKKQKYESKAKEVKSKYEKEMQQFQESKGGKVLGKRDKPDGKKENGGPAKNGGQAKGKAAAEPKKNDNKKKQPAKKQSEDEEDENDDEDEDEDTTANKKGKKGESEDDDDEEGDEDEEEDDEENGDDDDAE